MTDDTKDKTGHPKLTVVGGTASGKPPKPVSLSVVSGTGLKPVSLADLVSARVERPEPIIGDLRRGQCAVLSASRAAADSLVLQIALAASLGGDADSLFVKPSKPTIMRRPMRVLLLLTDGNPSLWLERIEAHLRGLGLEDTLRPEQVKLDIVCLGNDTFFDMDGVDDDHLEDGSVTSASRGNERVLDQMRADYDLVILHELNGVSHLAPDSVYSVSPALRGFARQAVINDQAVVVTALSHDGHPSPVLRNLAEVLWAVTPLDSDASVQVLSDLSGLCEKEIAHLVDDGSGVLLRAPYN